MTLDKDDKKTIEKFCAQITRQYQDAATAFEGAGDLDKALKAFIKASKKFDTYCKSQGGDEFDARLHAAQFLDGKARNQPMIQFLSTLKGGKKWDNELKQLAKMYAGTF